MGNEPCLAITTQLFFHGKPRQTQRETQFRFRRSKDTKTASLIPRKHDLKGMGTCSLFRVLLLQHRSQSGQHRSLAGSSINACLRPVDSSLDSSVLSFRNRNSTSGLGSSLHSEQLPPHQLHSPQPIANTHFTAQQDTYQQDSGTAGHISRTHQQDTPAGHTRHSILLVFDAFAQHCSDTARFDSASHESLLRFHAHGILFDSTQTRCRRIDDQSPTADSSLARQIQVSPDIGLRFASMPFQQPAFLTAQHSQHSQDSQRLLCPLPAFDFDSSFISQCQYVLLSLLPAADNTSHPVPAWCMLTRGGDLPGPPWRCVGGGGRVDAVVLR